MLIQMLADRFGAGGVLYAKGTQIDVATDLALRWIGDNVAAPVGLARETAQSIRKEVPVVLDQISSQQTAAGAPVSGAGTSQLSKNTGFDVPGTETTGGSWRDISDCGNSLTAASGVAAPHGTAGYISTEAGTGKVTTLPASKFGFDLAVDSFVFSVGVKLAQPGASVSLCGNISSATTGYGFYLSGRTNGTLVPIFNAAGGNWTLLTAPYPTTVLGAALDGTDHTVTIAYDAPSRSVYYWLDGVLKGAFSNVINPGSASRSTYPFGLGATQGAATATSVAGLFKNLKARVWAGSGLPLNINAMVRSMVAYPNDLRYLSDVYAASTNYSAIAWVGQSNEFGSTDWPDTAGAVGAPTRDTVTTTALTSITAATQGSMHPQVAALGGKRGIWRTIFNTAQGSTSICHNWCGQFVAWSAAGTYGKGAYAIAAGNIYKFTSSTNAGSPNVGVTAGSAPTWPGSGTVVDGEITWTYVRAATAADVVGTVLTSSHALFDPNGLFATIKTGLDALPSNYAGKRFVAISIGQGDKSVGTTQANYTAGIQSAANYLLAQGYKVLIGFTCSGVTAGLDAWLSGTGKPGYQAALASFAGNSNVFAGVDLYTSLGVLTVTANDVGLLADNLHMNRLTMPLAAALWDTAFATAGA